MANQLNRNNKRDKKYGRPTSGKSVSNEASIYRRLKEMLVTDTKVYYVMFKYCPEYLKDYTKNPIKTFDDLKDRYATFSDTITEEICERYLLEESVQNAVKWLLKRLHQKKLITLYEKYYEQAISGDTQAFKAFMDFSDKFFKDNKENDLTKLLNRISDDDLEDDEDYSYSYEENDF